MKHPAYFASIHPNKTAYRMARSGDAMTFAELDRLSNQGAQAFRSLGVGPGENIALLFENRLDFLALCWAAQRSGLFYTAISHHLTPGEIAYIVRDCEARIVVVSDAFEHLLGDLQGACEHARFFVCGDTDDPTLDWRALRSSMPATPIADEAAGSDLLYSSGTTGRPKGVMRVFDRKPINTVIPALMTVLCETLGGMGEDTIYLSPAPLYHAAPLRFSMMTAMLGGTAIIMEKFDAEECLALIEREKVSHSQFVPTMFVRMLKLPETTRRKYNHSTLKAAYHAAAPCPRDVKAQMIDWWGPILLEYYAGSEANGVTLTTSEEWLRHPGTVGRSLVGRIVVVDAAGRELAPGEIGDVYFRQRPEFRLSQRSGEDQARLSSPGLLDDRRRRLCR